jgi:hypothetical protein
MMNEQRSVEGRRLLSLGCRPLLSLIFDTNLANELSNTNNAKRLRLDEEYLKEEIFKIFARQDEYFFQDSLTLKHLNQTLKDVSRSVTYNARTWTVTVSSLNIKECNST